MPQAVAPSKLCRLATRPMRLPCPFVQASTITLLSETSTFGPLPRQPLGSPPFNVSATASTGLPVSFATP